MARVIETYPDGWQGAKFSSLTSSWWRHQMETFSAPLAFCVGNSPVTGAFPTQMPVTRSFDVFFELDLNKRLSKQSRGWWLEAPSSSLWRYCNDHGCWYPGDERSQDIGSHGIDLIHFLLTTSLEQGSAILWIYWQHFPSKMIAVTTGNIISCAK